MYNFPFVNAVQEKHQDIMGMRSMLTVSLIANVSEK